MNEQNTAMKPYVIGLDLGGTNSVFGIVDARGEIKATTAIKTGGYDKVEDYKEPSSLHLTCLGQTTKWCLWHRCSASV